MCHQTEQTAWSPGSKRIETCQPKEKVAAALVELCRVPGPRRTQNARSSKRRERRMQLKGFTGWEPPCFHDVWKHAEKEEKMPIYNGKALRADSLSDHSHSSIGAVTCQVALLNQQYLLLRGDMQCTESPSVNKQGACTVQTLWCTQ